LIAGTEESTILAFRVPQPLNYIDEPIEETGEEEQGLVMGEGEEEEENDEIRMEFDEQQQMESPADWESQQYGQQQEYAEFDEQQEEGERLGIIFAKFKILISLKNYTY
jgi:predicted alpha/beta superfamily hydrolase